MGGRVCPRASSTHCFENISALAASLSRLANVYCTTAQPPRKANSKSPTVRSDRASSLLNTPVTWLTNASWDAGLALSSQRSGEHFVSLTDEQIQHYKDLYDNVMVLTAERPENPGISRTSQGFIGSATKTFMFVHLGFSSFLPFCDRHS